MRRLIKVFANYPRLESYMPLINRLQEEIDSCKNTKILKSIAHAIKYNEAHHRLLFFIHNKFHKEKYFRWDPDLYFVLNVHSRKLKRKRIWFKKKIKEMKKSGEYRLIKKAIRNV